MSAGAVLLVIALAMEGATSRPTATTVRAEKTEWTVSAEPRGDGTASRVVDLHLTSRAGYHVNLEYPMAFLPSPDATARFPEARLALRPVSSAPCQRDHPEVCAVSLEVPYAPPPAGSARVTGLFAFSVCSAERCLIEKVPISIAIEPPAGAAPR